MKTILFQGDSITDAARQLLNNGNSLGTGYPLLTAAELGADFPGEYNFIDRGISGNRIVDIYARMKRDIINLKPDYMSLLIGVNDVWHEINESPNGVAAPKFEKIYKMLIEELKEALPNLKIMLMEPFLLPGIATDENWDYFKSEVVLRAEAAKRVADETGCKFVPLQAMLDEAYPKAEKGYWTGDGVHPSPFGHKLISREWIKAFNEIK